MRTLSAADLAHVAQDATTWAVCCMVRDTTGEVVRLTSHDRNLDSDWGSPDVLGLTGTYLTTPGIDASQVKGGADLAVDNLEVDALLDAAGITEQDIRTGRFNDAVFAIFLLNWREPSNSGIVLKSGVVGNIRDFVNGLAQVELRGLKQYLQQTITEAVSPTCRYVLGDDRCTVDLGAFTYVGEVTGVAIQRRQIESLIVGAVSPEPPEPIGAWFRGGRLTWLTGANAGLISEIKTDAENGDLTLLELTPYDIAIADTFTLTPGCDHAHAVTDGVASGDCHNKYDNVPNFGGEFNVPSQFSLIEAPD